MHRRVETLWTGVPAAVHLRAKCVETFFDPAFEGGDSCNSKSVRFLGSKPGAALRIALENAKASPAKARSSVVHGDAVKQGPFHAVLRIFSQQEAATPFGKNPTFGGVERVRRLDNPCRVDRGQYNVSGTLDRSLCSQATAPRLVEYLTKRVIGILGAVAVGFAPIRH